MIKFPINYFRFIHLSAVHLELLKKNLIWNFVTIIYVIQFVQYSLLKYISEAAGHSNEKFTFDRYIHTTEKIRDESVAIIDKVFGFDFPHAEKSQ